MPDNPYEASLEYGSDPHFVPPQQSTSARPVSVTVFGILNLLFGGLGLLGSISSVLMLLSFGGPFEIQYQLQFGLTIISTLLSFVCSVCALIGGVGLLRWQPYGRKYSIYYACLSIGSTLVSTIGTSVIMYNSTSQNNVAIALTMFLVMAVVGVLIRSIYPVLLLIFMQSHNVKSALSEPDATKSS